jgi:predicted neuraminidase
MKAEILHKGTVFTHKGVDPYSREAAYNHNHVPSITRLPNGKLLVAWYSGPWEGHYWQTILGSYSSDNGETWSDAEILQNTPNRADFDPAFVTDGRRVWLFYHVWRNDRYSKWMRGGGHPKDAWETSLGEYYRYTDDEGETWSSPVRIIEENYMGCWGVCRANGIRISTGDMMIAIYNKEFAGVLKSTDGGETWKRHGRVVGPAGNVEPTIVELGNGTVLMYLRTTDGYIWRATSEDDGETWSEALKTDIIANSSSHHLYRLSNGLIALAYNPCPPHHRTPLVLRLSGDDAKTWSKPVILDEVRVPESITLKDPLRRIQATYPSVTEDSMGRIVVVWAYRITVISEDPFCERDVCWGDIKVARLSAS